MVLCFYNVILISQWACFLIILTILAAFAMFRSPGGGGRGVTKFKNPPKSWKISEIWILSQNIYTRIYMVLCFYNVILISQCACFLIILTVFAAFAMFRSPGGGGRGVTKFQNMRFFEKGRLLSPNLERPSKAQTHQISAGNIFKLSVRKLLFAFRFDRNQNGLVASSQIWRQIPVKSLGCRSLVFNLHLVSSHWQPALFQNTRADISRRVSSLVLTVL